MCLLNWLKQNIPKSYSQIGFYWKLKFLMKSILLWNKSNLWKPSSYVHSNTTTITIIIYHFILHSYVIAGWCWHYKYNDTISSYNYWQNFFQRDLMFFVNNLKIRLSYMETTFLFLKNDNPDKSIFKWNSYTFIKQKWSIPIEFTFYIAVWI